MFDGSLMKLLGCGIFQIGIKIRKADNAMDVRFLMYTKVLWFCRGNADMAFQQARIES